MKRLSTVLMLRLYLSPLTVTLIRTAHVSGIPAIFMNALNPVNISQLFVHDVVVFCQEIAVNHFEKC